MLFVSCLKRLTSSNLRESRLTLAHSIWDAVLLLWEAWWQLLPDGVGTRLALLPSSHPGTDSRGQWKPALIWPPSFRFHSAWVPRPGWCQPCSGWAVSLQLMLSRSILTDTLLGVWVTLHPVKPMRKTGHHKRPPGFQNYYVKVIDCRPFSVLLYFLIHFLQMRSITLSQVR